MHVYFSGIGGTAIGPLAQIASQAGFDVSGSDEKDSQYIHYLKGRGINNIHIGQSTEQIAEVHLQKPIDWFVHSSALNHDHPEIEFCKKSSINISKRDEFLVQFISDKNLKLLAVAGTHGKTTSTAMAIWLFKQLGLPISYSVGAKIDFGEMGTYDSKSKFFVYECDEFDRNFLAFHPHIALVTGVAWDHHEIYHSQQDYNAAFKEFLSQSNQSVLWTADAGRLGWTPAENDLVLNEGDPAISKIKLLGRYNRQDAYLVARAVEKVVQQPLDKLLDLLSNFPGVSRRFEKLADNLYTDYAHTPEKIAGAMSVASEAVHGTGRKIIVVYEPLTNRRMHFTRELHRDIFEGADKIYWVPSYLAREDPSQKVLEPAELIKSLNPKLQSLAQPMKLDSSLKTAIDNHLSAGDLVLLLSGGGGGSLDEWARSNFSSQPQG